MNDIQFKGQIQKKLYREQTQLSHLQDLLARHDTTTHQMEDILSKFEGRLAKLENTITPVYTETATLQRRQENVEKTLQVLEHVISYYDVARDTQILIREGPNGRLDTYVDSLERIKAAITYFETNCPDSHEQVNLQELFEHGCDALQSEFRTLLSRHSKLIPPKVIIDALDRLNDDLSSRVEDGEGVGVGIADFDEVLGSEWNNSAHYPSKISAELQAISKWLVANKSLDFMSAYESIRLTTMTRSLEGLRSQLKSSTIGASTGTRFGMRQDSTPKKGMRGTIKNAVLAKKEAGASKQSIKKSNLEFDPDLELTEIEVEPYIQTLTALLILIQNERKLMEGVIPTQHRKEIFDRLVSKLLPVVVNEGKSIAERASKSVANHDHSPVLALFPVLRHLRCLRLDFEKALEVCKPSTQQQLTSLSTQLNATGARALEEFNVSIRRDPDRHLPEDGTVHQLTSNVLSFMNQTLDYQQIAGRMLASQDPSFNGAGSPEKAANIRSLSSYFIKLLGTLNLYLKNKSEHYDDPAKKAIFLLNNYNYIVSSLQSSGIVSLVSSLDNRMEMTYQQLVNDQRNQYLQCWNRVLHNCMESSSGPQIGVPSAGQKVKDKDRQIIKDKFANFNKELDELAGIQKFFAVPDSKLRDRLRKEIIKMVVPQYTAFHSKYLKISFSKNPEKYIKYSPEEVTSILEKFFDPTALTRP